MVVLGLDIDSTVVTHAYPAMGADIGAVPWLKMALEKYPALRIMVCTMRSGEPLELARVWLEERGIPVWALNAHPEQAEWTESPKPYAHYYVDDRAVGVPLRPDRCIDWGKYGPMLMADLERDLG
jgi:hypothetical protein